VSAALDTPPPGCARWDGTLLARALGDDAVDEVPKINAPPAAIVAGLDQAGGHVERGEQGGALAERMENQVSTWFSQCV
jgi:hypothetical protein